MLARHFREDGEEQFDLGVPPGQGHPAVYPECLTVGSLRRVRAAQQALVTLDIAEPARHQAVGEVEVLAIGMETSSVDVVGPRLVIE